MFKCNKTQQEDRMVKKIMAEESFEPKKKQQANKFQPSKTLKLNTLQMKVLHYSFYNTF